MATSKQHLTNADRIRAMTDEDLAEFVEDCFRGGFLLARLGVLPAKAEEHLEWLQQEAEQ